MSRIIFTYLVSGVFFVFSIGVFSHFFIRPFFYSDVVISADPYFFMSLLLGSSSGFFLTAPFNVIYRHIKGVDIPVKNLVAITLFFGGVAVLMNQLIYQLLIYPNDLVECPAGLGYKENLLTDYVTNVTFCEKE